MKHITLGCYAAHKHATLLSASGSRCRRPLIQVLLSYCALSYCTRDAFVDLRSLLYDRFAHCGPAAPKAAPQRAFP